ncbi:sensor histidine kinase [Leeuwenhoekiella sp. MAR_2009_132]|uniref:GAF domain-containing sensor histidine kinase n=1 Tax=Leeuwenhoekiella sp. MAR_2009_132 TaxID=1392489 RepID=UPI0004910D9B|nr:HAMP domain-containing sensor histidine kinase [Leeuwenhoekiella sp. MAR_2009_132]
MINKDFLRVQKLADLDLDYESLRSEFGPLSVLAAKIAGTELSEVNFIDNYTQWTVAGTLDEFSQKSREESICNFTIEEKHHFESRVDLDPRFKNSDYVKNEGYKFYYGIPLRLGDDIAIGTLCVGGKKIEELSDAQIEQLHIIAKQIVKHIQLKFETQKAIQQAHEEKLLKLRLAHDVRSPLSGISQLIELNDFESQTKEELQDIVKLISAASSGILQLTNDILKDHFTAAESKMEAQFTVASLASKLSDLYSPQARSKNIELSIDFKEHDLTFPRRNLLPLIGNLISNAIKFTRSKEQVHVYLAIEEQLKLDILKIEVKDWGVGMNQNQIDAILNTQSIHKAGTSGELGYGMGLLFVKELIANLNGTMHIESTKHQGTQIRIEIPLL